MSRVQLSRRHFLKSSGGFALALPFLESLAPITAFAQSAEPIKRFIAIMGTQGYHEPVYYPSVAAETRFSDHIYHRTLQSIPGALTRCIGTDLDAYRAQMNIYRGLDIPGAGGHSPVMGLASARRLIAGDSSPIDPPANCRSLDVVLGMSKEFYQNTPKFKALRAEQGWSIRYSIDKDQAGKTVVLPYTLWPADMYEAVFAGMNLSGSEANSIRAKKATIGDLVKGSMQRLVSDRRISSSDKVLVNNFVAQIQELNTKINQSPLTCALPSKPSRHEYLDLLSPNERHQLALQFVDIIMAAFACDLTRVAVISIEGGTYAHDLSHSDYHNAAENQRYVDLVRERELPVVKKVVEKMNGVVESNGKTMLENSLVFWGNEQSAGNAHCSTSMPAITFGSMNGAIKTGHYVDYRQRPFKYYAGRSDIFPAFGSESYNQLMNTIFRGMGVPASFYQQFGEDGGFGTCNPGKSYLEYIQGEYDLFPSKRNNTLPFISLV